MLLDRQDKDEENAHLFIKLSREFTELRAQFIYAEQFESMRLLDCDIRYFYICFKI